MSRLLALIALPALLALSGCLGKTSDVQFQSSTLSTSALGNSAVLTWSSNRGEQTGFKVEQSTDGTNFKLASTVMDGTNQAIVGPLNPGHLYYFRVYGYNAAGNSPYTPVVQIQF